MNNSIHWMTNKMEFLFNYPDPRRLDFVSKILIPSDETNCWAFAKQKRTWLSTKIISAPLATEQYSVAQLVAMGLIGVYEPDPVDNPAPPA